MRVVIDIECNSLNNPTQIWLIVCQDIDTNQLYIFRNVTTDEEALKRFVDFDKGVRLYIGHNLLGYDWSVIRKLLGHFISREPRKAISEFCDTLIVSKLVNYSRQQGHSVETYGREFGIEKGKFNDWTKWSQELEDYCVRDVEITSRIFRLYGRIIDDPSWWPAIDLEQRFQLICNSLHVNGFSFNVVRAEKLLKRVTDELAGLDKEILHAFPPRLKARRDVYPVVTQHGTLNRKDFRWVASGDLGEFNGGPFTLCEWVTFNPASHRQVIEVLCTAGWAPVDRTDTHVDTLRETNRLKYQKHKTAELALRLQACYTKLERLGKYGWKINENNLATLPNSAPPPARLLAKRILLESRRRTLTEWLGLVHPDTGRIHGDIYGIGTWTHRTAIQKPNMQNIPNEFKEDGTVKFLGKELRSCWCAPRKRLLLGVDAEGIQFRIAAHYIGDQKLIDGIVNGKKSDGTDPHSLNKRLIGEFCKTRGAAKRVLFALILGGGPPKFAWIMGSTPEQGEEARDILYRQYPGLVTLKNKIVVEDAKRGFFLGLDGRKVPVPGDTVSERKHLMPSGYLQNGEAVIMKLASVKWEHRLKEFNSLLVNLVHDEWQTETPNDMAIALQVAKLQSDSLREVGEDLGLRCPLAGSYWNDDLDDYTIGTSWAVTH